jgi:hypothetical protein
MSIFDLRKDTFSNLLPETKGLIIRLYGTYEAYVSITDMATNPKNILEEACILYDRSSEYEDCAMQGLRLLGFNEKDVIEDPSITLYISLLRIINTNNHIGNEDIPFSS